MRGKAIDAAVATGADATADDDGDRTVATNWTNCSAANGAACGPVLAASVFDVDTTLAWSDSPA